MKKFLTIAAALALVLGLSQCRKPNAPAINGIGETQHVTLTSSFGGDGSKLDVQTVLGSLNLKWVEGDVISIAEPNHGSLVCISASYDEDTKVSTGTFEGDITHVSGEITFTVGTEPSYRLQDGGEINEDKIYLVGTSEYKSDGNYNVQMKLPYAVLKLDLHKLVSTTGDVTVKVEGVDTAIMKGVTTTEKDLFVMIPLPNEEKNTLCTFTGDKGSHNETYNLAPNTYYTADGASVELDVNETNKYCDFNDPKMGVSGLPIWAKYNVGANVDRILNDFEHAVAADWYGGYYQWGRATTTTNYAWTNCPHTNGEYKPKNQNVFTKYVPQAVASTYGYENFYDNMTVLENGEDPACVSTSDEWRSPTKEELAQLKENTYFQWTKNYNGIEGLNGYIVYMVKDESHKNCLTGCPTDKPWVTKKGTENTEYYVGQENPFSYTTSNPHLFLPAAGYMLNTNVSSTGSSGYYKSRSIKTDEPNLHWAMYFTKSSAQPQKGCGRQSGYSIRAVRNVSGK